MLESILVTGFGPFETHTRDISEEAVRRLDGVEIDGFVLRGVTLPGRADKAIAALEEAIDGAPPAAIIALGAHADPAQTFKIELGAKNDDGALDRQGPAVAYSTLPVAAIKQAFDGAGLATELSDDAGRSVGNALLYWAARRITPAGFIHVPSAAERADDVARAARIAAEVTVKRLVALRVEAEAATV